MKKLLVLLLGMGTLAGVPKPVAAQEVMSASLVDHKKNGDSLLYVHVGTDQPLSGAYKFIQSDDAYELAHFSKGMLEGSYKKYRYGKCVTEGVYKTSQKDKTWRYYSMPYDRNDAVYLEREEYYEDGLPQGEWVRYKTSMATDFKPAPIEKVRFNKGGAELRETYDERGWLSSSCTYRNNVKHGMYHEYYPDGKPMVDVEYRMGQKAGTTTAYHANGQASKKGQYNEAGDAFGKWESWFEDGTLAGWTHYKNGTLSGDFESYHPNGKLLEKGTYSDEGNRAHIGRYQRFYENGQQAEDIRYDQTGRKQGKSTSWYANGNTKRDATYRNNAFIGEDKRHFENGQLEELTTYSEKEYVVDEWGDDNEFAKSGPYRRYDSDGQLVEEGTYDHDKKQGEWKSYTQGKLRRVQQFEDGMEAGKYILYHDGRLREEGAFKIVTDEYGGRYSKKDGLWVEYYYEAEYPSGLKKWEIRWKDGIKHGKSVRYNADGKVRFTEDYDQGKSN
ncbi:toxin-antitoxin system YwqK family antitoxin [Parapedobacter tibetensis]|uniref:toxin-antitoxin system YwqK family antitoxin n=1 Tax=Parapedobacter tibetensis TaxID=2972951 RepID=UPI00214DC103|nr:toxin-antitoxin system YwqK family antitoxin [Parapedobacter tibetensis]